MKPVLGIIADDFTGANDTGVQFSKKGVQTAVVFDSERLTAKSSLGSVVVVDTESRFDEPDVAAKKVAAATGALRSMGVTYLYKKLDSTMRGNVGAEIAAALEVSGYTLAVAAPALPANGRITREGACIVNGVPVAETEIRNDPRTPVHTSDIVEIIQHQSDLPVRKIGLHTVRAGAVALLNELGDADATDGPEVALVDAETDEDLQIIGQAIFQAAQPVLLVGTAGLAGYLPAPMYRSEQDVVTLENTPPVNTQAPCLFVVGTVSSVTSVQVTELCAAHGDIIELAPNLENLIVSPLEEQERIYQQAAAALKSGAHCVIRTSKTSDDVDRLMTNASRQNIAPQEAGALPARMLGAITAQILTSLDLRGLFISGGDTAIRVAEQLGATGFLVGEEVLPGIPAGRFVANGTVAYGACPVVTKAGGFGKPDALKEIFRYMRGLTW